MAVCLVTGGAGFIGSHLVEALVARGHTVRVFDKASPGAVTNLAAVADRIELIPGDVGDPDLVRRSTKGAELVFHLAPPTFSSQTLPDPHGVRWACALDVLHVLIAAHEAGVRRVVYASTASIYGDVPAGQPLSEADPPAPGSPYAFAKLVGEQHCIAFTTAHGLDTVRLRYFPVFGPRQLNASPCGQVMSIIRAVLAGQNPVLEGGGQQPLDLTYVDDVVAANLLAAETPRAAGRVYNIARGRPTTLAEVVATVNAILGTALEPVAGAAPALELQHGLADIARAEAELGFCPTTDLELGLRLCIAACMPGWEGALRSRHLPGTVSKGPHLHRFTEPAAPAAEEPEPKPGAARNSGA